MLQLLDCLGRGMGHKPLSSETLRPKPMSLDPKSPKQHRPIVGARSCVRMRGFYGNSTQVYRLLEEAVGFLESRGSGALGFRAIASAKGAVEGFTCQ